MAATILVVDDLPENLRLLAGVLADQGYKVRLASSGAYALTTIQKELPDLILLDIKMPDMDGYEVCHFLKADERTREIPVIFISALNEVFDKVAAFSVGGLDYITKPFQVEELLARVKTHLALRQLQAELADKNKELQEAKTSLEEKVKARTAELAAVNESLQAEIARRRRQQQEKDKLLDLVRQQSEQLRMMMSWLIKSQQQEFQGLSQALGEGVIQSLAVLNFNLELIQTLASEVDPKQALPAQDMILAHLNDSRHILSQTQQQMANVTTDLHQLTTQEQKLLQNPLINLSSREREVLKLLVDGKSNSEIAELLSLSISTAQTYRTRIMRKLNLETVADLVKFAIKHRLASIE